MMWSYVTEFGWDADHLEIHTGHENGMLRHGPRRWALTLRSGGHGALWALLPFIHLVAAGQLLKCFEPDFLITLRELFCRLKWKTYVKALAQCLKFRHLTKSKFGYKFPWISTFYCNFYLQMSPKRIAWKARAMSYSGAGWSWFYNQIILRYVAYYIPLLRIPNAHTHLCDFGNVMH